MTYSTSLLLIFALLSPALAQESEVIWKDGGHSSEISATVFSPDSRTLVSSGIDGLIHVWDPASGRLLRTLDNGSGSVLSLSYSRDGRFLAAGNVGGTVELWNMTEYRLVRTYPAGSPARAVAISPDGLTIASGHPTGEVILWDLDLVTIKRTLAGHSEAVNAVAFSNDSKMVASGSDDFALILWNAESGAQIKKLVQSQLPTTALAFSPDGQRIASSGKGHSVEEFSLPDLTPATTPNSHTVTISSIAYSPDGRLIASVSEDYYVPGFILEETLIVSDRQGRKKIFEFQQETAGGYGTSVVFSPNGRYLAWGSSSGMLRVREVAPAADTAIFIGGHRTITDHYDRINATAFSPVGGILASAGSDGRINLWRGGSGILIRTLDSTSPGITALDFTRDGRSLATAGLDGSVRIWDVTTGRMQSIIYVSPESPATSVAFSPDGRRIVAGAGFGSTLVGIWDTSRLDPVRTFTGHTSHINAVAWGGDGSQVISASDDNTVKVWNSTTGALEMTLDEANRPYLSLALAANGVSLAAGNFNGMIKVWAMPSGDPLADLDGRTGQVNALDISSNGQFIVSATSDRGVNIWEVAARSQQHRYFDSHPSLPLAVAINADSGWVASGTMAATVIVWKLVTTSSVRDAADGALAPISAMPNPFGDRITFEFALATAGPVDGAVFNLQGERVATFAEGRREAGVQRIEWDAAGVDDGVYLYRIVTGDGVVGGTIVRGSGW